MAEPKIRITSTGKPALSFMLLVTEHYRSRGVYTAQSFMIRVFMTADEGRLPGVATGDRVIVSGKLYFDAKTENSDYKRSHYIFADGVARAGADSKSKEHE